jgi:biotin-independent malonate decarboxylase gamma subunit
LQLLPEFQLSPELKTFAAVRGIRSRRWIEALSMDAAKPALACDSVLWAPLTLGDEEALAFAVVRDEQSAWPRARHGELGLEAALALAACVRSAVDSGKALVAIVDTAGQALGRAEEVACLSAACAAAVEAYAVARSAGCPVLTLVVGGAFSGAFLAHGLQTDAVLALDDGDVSMQAMTARSIARITRRTLAEVERTAAEVVPMSYAIRDAWRLGIVDELLDGVRADEPTREDVICVRAALTARLQGIRAQQANGAVTPRNALRENSLRDNPLRAATVRVQDLMREQWRAADAVII